MTKSPHALEVQAWIEGHFRVGGYPVAVYARWEKGQEPRDSGFDLTGLVRPNPIPFAELTNRGSPPGLIYRLATELQLPNDFEFLDGLLPDLGSEDLDLELALSWRNRTASQVQAALVVLGVGLSREQSPPPPTREPLQFFFSWLETSPAEIIVGVSYNKPIHLPSAPGILRGLFDDFSITGLTGVYSHVSLGSDKHTIPGITVFDVDTLTTTVVSQPLELALEKGFSLLATLRAPGTIEHIVLPLTLSRASHHRHRGHDTLAATGTPGPPASKPVAKWFDVNKTFGPLKIQRVELLWEDGKVGVGFDASITIKVLTLGLDGLVVKFDLEKIARHDFLHSVSIGLSGLSLAYRSGPVEIAGGFLETKISVGGEEVTQYVGEAVIQLENFGLSALGSYAELHGQPALFVFALLEIPLGDPTETGAFFITGFAAGFGYNQDLILPDQNQVQNFPLVAAALDPGKVFPGGSGSSVSLQQAVDVLDHYIPPKLGENWLAAGIRFTSWEMLQSFALLTVAFGTRLELALLGLSQLKLPTPTESGGSTELIAEVQMGIEVKVDPSAGLLAATAVLTPNSWILSQDCKIQGGFAFYLWFSGAHAGEFVVTLGGYNPAFKPPHYYPREPRLGFNWAISPQLTCKGGCYFALTPHMVMAGGALDVVFQDGGLRAWLTAHADFLIEWQPFHFQITIGVSVGVSYTFDILGIKKTISVSLGAGVELEGPPFGGDAHIHLYVISATISFGARTGPAKALTFDEFQAALLPRTNPVAGRGDGLTASGAGRPVVCTAKIARGVRTGAASGKATTSPSASPVVTAGKLRLHVASAIPATTLASGGGSPSVFHTCKDKLYIKPMQQAHPYRSQLSVRVRVDGKHDVTDKFELEPVLSNVPAALWTRYEGRPKVNAETSVVPDAPVGITLTPRSTVDHNLDPSAPISLANLLAPLPHRISVDWASYEPVPTAGDDSPLATVEDTIADPAVSKTRADVLERLAELGVANMPAAVALGPELTKDTERFFLAPPRLANLGQAPT